ncbi:MAG: hypothetical protein MJ219_01315 [Mycoplasmoidaceae bacterium]|nr:hypothetical protein [Mycoplasmoidaceae bacterium]
MYEEISESIDDYFGLIDFPSFDVKYKNFKAELDASNNPFVSYDLEIFAVFDTETLDSSQSNGTEQYR